MASWRSPSTAGRPVDRAVRAPSPSTWSRPSRARWLVLVVAVGLLSWSVLGPLPVAGLVTTTTDGTPAADSTDLGPSSVEGPLAAADLVSPASLGTDSTVWRLGERAVRPGSLAAISEWPLPLGLLVAGYTRHATADPLDNDARRTVYRQVEATPGAHIAAIVDRTGIPRSTVRYHLHVLEEADLLASGMVRGRHRYAPVDVDLTLASALHDEPTRELLAAIARYGPVSVTGLADETGLAVSTVSHHLDHLVGADLLERERAGGRALHTLAPAAGLDLEARMGSSGRDQSSSAFTTPSSTVTG